MNEHIAEKFIDLIAKLYDLSDKAIDTMRGNAAEIDSVLGAYYWADVKDAVNLYFARKNDKTRPTLAKVLALLETNEKVKKRVPDAKPDTYHLPRTQLWTIRDAFDHVIKAMVMCEILKPENPMDTPLRPGYSLLDSDNLPMINPKRRLRAMVTAAKNRRPDLFAQYKSLSFWEELAICVQNHLVKLRIRDWHAFHQGLPEGIKDVIRNRGSNALGETSAQVKRMIAAWPGAATVGVLEV